MAATTVTDELLANNAKFAEGFKQGDLPLPPSKHVAVLACMDARMDVHKILGLDLGQAHVIRNAGGVVTDDELRCLVISQRLLGTHEIILIHHTDCGMLTFNDDEVKQQIADDVGSAPDYELRSFSDCDDSIRDDINRIKADPHIPNKDSIRGFVYEVETGKLREVS